MASFALLLIPFTRASADMSVTLEGTGNQQDFPTLKIHITRDGESRGFLRVRFPEGIDAARAGDRRHLKYYQDIRSPAWPAKLETEPSNLPVEWSGTDQSVSYEMTLDNGMVLKAKADVSEGPNGGRTGTPSGPRITLSYELLNATETDLASCQIWSCNIATMCPPIADYLLERTGALVDGRFRLFRDLIPTFEQWERSDAEYQRVAAYADRMIPNTENPKVHPHPGFPDDPAKATHFYHAVEPYDLSAIATIAVDGTWAVSTIGETVHSVWMNPGISCQHADPIGKPLAPGGTLSVTKTIHIIDGDVTALEAYLSACKEPAQ